MATRHERPEADKRNIRLVVEYDGTDFCGWQRQPGCRSVQEELETAIAAVTREKASLLSSGRTDAGVHAEGHVCNFRTSAEIPAARLAAAINTKLAEDVIVLSAEDAPFSFHATHDAKSKLYRYRIARGRVRPVLDRRYSYHVRGPLDVDAMRRAAAHFVGTHDFNSFRAEGFIEKDTVRTIHSVELAEANETLEIYFRGDGFLYMMLRIIVGTLVRVGKGKIAPEAIPGIIAARDRAAAGPTVPPRGLCLVAVYY